MTQAQAIEILNRWYWFLAGRIQVSDREFSTFGEGGDTISKEEADAANEAWRVVGGSGLLLSKGRLYSSIVEELKRAGFPRAVPQATSSRFNTGAAVAGGVIGFLVGGPIGAATAGFSAGILFRR